MSQIQIFVCYSHCDDRWVKAGPHGLIPWLAQSLRKDGVRIWYDPELQRFPGTEYEKLIKSEIDRARVAILLISQDFVNSDFIQRYELPWIRTREELGLLAIIPILVGHTDEDDLDWLAKRQMLPGEPSPLIDYVKDESQWQRVRVDILRAIRYRVRGLAGHGPADDSPRVSAPNLHADSESPPASIIVSELPATPPSDGPIPLDPVVSEKTVVETPGIAMRTVSVRDVPPRRPSAIAKPHFEIINSIGMKLVLIKPGEFIMGSSYSDNYSLGLEMPQHRVRITEAFYLGAYPVTQTEYERVMGANPSRFKGEPDVPVEMVSWEDVQEFCRRLSAVKQERMSGRAYCLPTEAQWEYACRAGSTERWCFGDYESQLSEYAWYDRNSSGKVHSVGRKSPNAWGLCDMYGNVWEWCADWYCDRRYYYDAKLACAEDPTGPATGLNRLNRGGSFVSPARVCRCANRSNYAPGDRDSDLGFRVCIVPARESDGDAIRP